MCHMQSDSICVAHFDSHLNSLYLCAIHSLSLESRVAVRIEWTKSKLIEFDGWFSSHLSFGKNKTECGSAISSRSSAFVLSIHWRHKWNAKGVRVQNFISRMRLTDKWVLWQFFSLLFLPLASLPNQTCTVSALISHVHKFSLPIPNFMLIQNTWFSAHISLANCAETDFL